MLYPNIIQNISKKLIEISDDNQIEYNASIVTNGYLLTEKTINMLIQNHVDHYQITIDGPSEVHDRQRYLSGGEPTFDVIVSNVEKLENKDVLVNIRINIDKTNQGNYKELVNIFKKRKIKNVKFYLGRIKNYNESTDKNILSDKEYRKKIKDFSLFLKTSGYESTDEESLPMSTFYCGALYNNNYIIDHEGYVYDCWNDFGIYTRAKENIVNGQTDMMRNNAAKYINFNPFIDEKCKDCIALPICLGSCPYETIELGKRDCISFELMINNYIDKIVNNK